MDIYILYLKKIVMEEASLNCEEDEQLCVAMRTPLKVLALRVRITLWTAACWIFVEENIHLFEVLQKQMMI